MNEAPDLKPCPFCGRPPEGPIDATRILGVWRIIHRGCTVLKSFDVERSDRSAVIAAWNTRAPLPADAIATHPAVAALVEAAQDAEYDLLQWIECGEWLTKAGFNMDGTPQVAAKLTAALAALRATGKDSE